MAGQKFQYDESGSTFFYFILSFLALILIPATFYFWPKKKTEGSERKSNSKPHARIVLSKKIPARQKLQDLLRMFFQIPTKARKIVIVKDAARSERS